MAAGVTPPPPTATSPNKATPGLLVPAATLKDVVIVEVIPVWTKMERSSMSALIRLVPSKVKPNGFGPGPLKLVEIVDVIPEWM